MLVSDIDKIIAGELGVRREQVAKAIELLDDGNTVPFIARYRSRTSSCGRSQSGSTTCAASRSGRRKSRRKSTSRAS